MHGELQCARTEWVLPLACPVCSLRGASHDRPLTHTALELLMYKTTLPTGRHPGEVRRGADRRQATVHRPCRGPAAVQERDDQDRPQDAHQRHRRELGGRHRGARSLLDFPRSFNKAECVNRAVRPTRQMLPNLFAHCVWSFATCCSCAPGSCRVCDVKNADTEHTARLMAECSAAGRCQR